MLDLNYIASKVSAYVAADPPKPALEVVPVLPSRKQPRSYQTECLAAVREAVLRHRRRMLVVMATGGGKTIVFSQIPGTLGLQRDEKVLILVHRDELATQAMKKYNEMCPGEMVGIEMGKSTVGPMNRVCVGSVQTLQGARLEDFLLRFGEPTLVITDEAHHATSSSYVAIYSRLGIKADGDIVHVGVTATPKRGDNVGLAEVFDEIVYSLDIGDLIDMGYLVDLRGYRVETDTSLAGLHKRAGDFEAKELAERVNNGPRNAKIVRSYLDLTPGEPAICFCASIAHSEEMTEAFNVAGVSAVHVDGAMRMDKRREALEGFRTGKYLVCCNAQVLTEGYDNPNVRVVIIGRPTSKQGNFAQMVGRGTRPLDSIAPQLQDDLTNAERRAIIAMSGKPYCTVIDVVDMARNQTLASLPALMGLPANFDLKGRSAASVAKRYANLSEESDTAASIVENVEMLDVMENCDPKYRTQMLLRYLLDTDKKQKYVPLDLLRPKALPEWAREAATMTWFATGEKSFRLNLNKKGETIHVEGNQLNQFDVFARSRDWVGDFVIGAYGAIKDAMANAEKWVRIHRAASVDYVDANTRWRNARPSQRQLNMLKDRKVSVSATATAGEVSDVITALIGRT